ncbi:MAG: carbon storage regulator [Planctomycetales bacterium]|nr:carbon storage regulator [Planctomycetales bacterium]
MLVLSRKVEQAVVIPAHGVTFRVLDILGDRVRLGIEAPHEVAVHRNEVWELMQRSGQNDGQPPATSSPDIDQLRRELETVAALAELGIDTETASPEMRNYWQSVREAAERCRQVLSRWPDANRTGHDGDQSSSSGNGNSSRPSAITTMDDAADETAQRTILVVEDHDQHRVQVAAWLRESGHRVIAAKDVDQALDYLWRYRSGINLVVCGWLNADPGARGLLNRLQAEATPVPLVLLCNDLGDDAIRRLREEGFADVVNRPENRDELDVCLRHVFDARRAARERVST